MSKLGQIEKQLALLIVAAAVIIFIIILILKYPALVKGGFLESAASRPTRFS